MLKYLHISIFFIILDVEILKEHLLTINSFLSMGFFKQESMRLAKESISFLDTLDGQEYSLTELENKFPSLFSNWEEWEYDAENENVSALGVFGLSGEYDKLLTIRVRPINEECFVIYGAMIEEL